MQKRDGSFGSLPTTIRYLFALHLLQRSSSNESDRALDWIWEAGLARPEPRRSKDGAVYQDLLFRIGRGEAARLSRMTGTPFNPGCSGFIKTGAGILLASGYGRGREARVQRALRCLDEVIAARNGLWCTPVCSNNILQAYAAHPDACRGRGLARAVRALGKMQTATGSWPGLPFTSTFSALATVDLREARTQFKRALPLVRRSQNLDGSWGRGPRREFTSFQMVRALRAIEA